MRAGAMNHSASRVSSGRRWVEVAPRELPLVVSTAALLVIGDLLGSG